MASSFLAFATERFESEITPVLEEYIAIPAKSPHFEPAWAELGHIDRAVRLLESWARSRPIAGLRSEVVTLPGRTPVILLEIPAFNVPASDDAVLLYGHLDKQPEMVGWEPDLGPWKPVRRGDRLYGRGGADDGYAIFASLTAIEAVQASGGKHVRCVVLIEACEESGSYDLPHYVEHLLPRIGTPSLVVCLDSGAGDYERLWMTTSLRGLVAGTLSARVLDEGVHSGDASGVVPSSFRVLRQLLDRIEDAKTGRFLLSSFHTEVPPLRREQAAQSARLLGDSAWKRFPWAGQTQPMSDDPATIALARTWTPMLSVTGAQGLPAIGSAGNVLRPETALKLSVRIPPGVDAPTASAELKAALERDPPSSASVHFEPDQSASGWQAPVESPWLLEALGQASRANFGAEAAYIGEGGTIPFMAMLGARFPAAEFVITGVLGPRSNAHGPNEFLHLPMAIRLTACVADVLVRHAAR